MDYRAELAEKQAEIEYKIIAHVKGDSKIHYNKHIAIEGIEHILDTRMTLWISTATSHPNPSKDFDAVAFFMARWIANIYPLVRKELFGYVTKYYKHVELDETLASDSDLEEDTMILLLKEDLKRANTEFLAKLKGADQKIFWCMLKALSDEGKAAHIFPNDNYTTKIRDKVRYMTNIVEFKYSCFLLTKRIYDRDRIVQTMNKSPKLVKRYFNVDKLTAVPSDTDLLAAALEVKPAPKVEIEVDATWTPISKVDFNGKKHDHVVVYQKDDKLLYDHVTRSVRAL